MRLSSGSGATGGERVAEQAREQDGGRVGHRIGDAADEPSRAETAPTTYSRSPSGHRGRGGAGERGQ
jgi:hypothetical protein